MVEAIRRPPARPEEMACHRHQELRQYHSHNKDRISWNSSDKKTNTSNVLKACSLSLIYSVCQTIGVLKLRQQTFLRPNSLSNDNLPNPKFILLWLRVCLPVATEDVPMHVKNGPGRLELRIWMLLLCLPLFVLHSRYTLVSTVNDSISEIDSGSSRLCSS